MKYKERYDLIYDTHNDCYVNPARPIEFIIEAKGKIESYEDNLAEAAWYRSTQDGYFKGEQAEQQARNQRLK